MPKKNILITGGSGFLAGITFKELQKEKSFNIVIGSRRPDKLCLEDEYLSASHIYFDMNDTQSFSPALKNRDIIIHFAAMNYADCEKNPNLAQKINTDHTKTLATIAKQENIKKLIYMSSIHVYGAPLTGELTEETMTHPKNAYAATHKFAEDLLIKHHLEQDFETVILRLSNALGVPVRKEVNVWDLVAFDLCRQAFETDELILNSTGSQQRNFISTKDIAQCIEHFIIYEQKETSNPIYNLGSLANLSILQFAELVKSRAQKMFKKEVTLHKKESKPEDGKGDQFIFNLNKLTETGFSPQHKIEDEIDHILSYNRKQAKEI